MTNRSPDPRERAWTQVGRFMYHFARVEQKINQAVIKLTELDAKATPVVELIYFGRKVNDLVRASAYAQATNNADKDCEGRVQQSVGHKQVPNDHRPCVFRTYRRRSAIQQSGDIARGPRLRMKCVGERGDTQ